ncbi:cation-transporting P-type ATPase [Paractinoplanes rishiriensis]|uniref:Uncharacterized protein n=1 Tax=Paractinoplanes rishiriensis TaxID=1050105 RepID=A0A919N034_9ACTN|nr:cation-transporting P-type ATPase [Actinoplanes rishiriensis]GIF02309.1 hypothetical protein Ari01nite_97730 [Actinoplanes rishiriensis]
MIASDKTGTLTENRMSVQQAITADGARYTVAGTGYAPDGEIRSAGTTSPAGDDLRRLAVAGLLCNDADLIAPADNRPDWTAAGDPMEAALLAFAGRCDLDIGAERAPRRGQPQPFDQATRSMTTVHPHHTGGYLVIRKGARENLLDPTPTRACSPPLPTSLATGCGSSPSPPRSPPAR